MDAVDRCDDKPILPLNEKLQNVKHDILLWPALQYNTMGI